MTRRPLIAGNWKMHTTVAEAEQLAAAVVQAAQDKFAKTNVGNIL